MNLKKAVKYSLYVLLALIITLTLTYQIAPNWVRDKAVSLLYPTVTIEKQYLNTVTIEIPEVYELMYIACSLTKTFEEDENLISSRTPNYRNEVNEHFTKFKEHALVKLLESKLEGNAYSQIQPAIRLFSLNYNLNQENSLEDNKIFHVNPILIKLFKSRIFYYPEYLDLIEDFAQKTDFFTFYTEHSKDYQTLKNSYRQLCDIEKNVGLDGRAISRAIQLLPSNFLTINWWVSQYDSGPN